MTALIALAIAAVVMTAFDVFVSKFGAEDRPGFDERAPLS